MLREITGDLVELSRMHFGGTRPMDLLRTAAMSDSFTIAALTRMREAARAAKVPGVNHLLRMLQTALYGIEIGNEATLGRGVWFVHTVGTIVGGDARIGDRVRLCGGNAIGTARDDGYPVIDDDAIVGMHACVLGPVHVGRGALVGANAIVLHDVPAGALAVGVPAVVKERRHDPHQRGGADVPASGRRGEAAEPARGPDVSH